MRKMRYLDYMVDKLAMGRAKEGSSGQFSFEYSSIISKLDINTTTFL